MIHLASSAFGVLGIVVFSAWFLLTAAFQRKTNFATLVSRFDRFSLIPRWSFFAPDPGANNYHFVYRSRDEEHGASPWSELNLSSTGIRSALWNPQRRYRENLIELFQLLAVSGAGYSANQLQFTTPYVILLGIARQRLESSLTPRAFYQFALVETRGPNGASQPLIRFCSLAHPVA